MQILILVLALVSGVVALVLFLRAGRPVAAGFGLTVSRRTPADVLVGLVVPAVAIGSVFLVEWLGGGLDVRYASPTLGALATGLVAYFLVGAVFEELVYRVLLVTGLSVVLERFRYGRWITVVATGVLFGAAHLGNTGATWLSAVSNGLGGVTYAIAVLGTRSVWLPTALHFSWNLVQGILGMPVSGTNPPGLLVSESTGDVLLTGGIYGPEGGLPGLTVRFLVIAAVVLYLRRRFPDGTLRTLEFAPELRGRSAGVR